MHETFIVNCNSVVSISASEVEKALGVSSLDVVCLHADIYVHLDVREHVCTLYMKFKMFIFHNQSKPRGSHPSA